MKIEIIINGKGLKIEGEDRNYTDEEIKQYLKDIETALLINR